MDTRFRSIATFLDMFTSYPFRMLTEGSTPTKIQPLGKALQNV